MRSDDACSGRVRCHACIAGAAYDSKGEKAFYEKAIEYHQMALDIRLARLGPKDPDIANSYFNLGMIAAIRSL